MIWKLLTKVVKTVLPVRLSKNHIVLKKIHEGRTVPNLSKLKIGDTADIQLANDKIIAVLVRINIGHGDDVYYVFREII